MPRRGEAFLTSEEKRRRRGAILRQFAGWGVMAPGVILFSFFVWMPLLMNIYLSFFSTKGFSAEEFVGLGTYQELFEHPDFLTAFGNTFTYLGWSLLIGFVLPIIIGLLLSEVIHCRALFRIGIYLPAAIAGLTASILFTYLFDPSSAGFLNTILEGLGMEPILWLDDPNLVIPLIVVTMTWRGAGSTALIYLSAFAGIDRSYYEAAQIDGAGVWSRIVHITLPQIVPSMTTLFVLQIISVMQVFYEPFVMTNGGGGDRSSLSLLLLAYNFGFRDGRVDLSSACTVVLFLIILALSAVYYLAVRLLKKRGYRV